MKEILLAHREFFEMYETIFFCTGVLFGIFAIIFFVEKLVDCLTSDLEKYII